MPKRKYIINLTKLLNAKAVREKQSTPLLHPEE